MCYCQDGGRKIQNGGGRGGGGRASWAFEHVPALWAVVFIWEKQSSCVAQARKLNFTKYALLTALGLYKSQLAFQSDALNENWIRYKMHLISRLLYPSFIILHINSKQLIWWYAPIVIIRTDIAYMINKLIMTTWSIACYSFQETNLCFREF